VGQTWGIAILALVLGKMAHEPALRLYVFLELLLMWGRCRGWRKGSRYACAIGAKGIEKPGAVSMSFDVTRIIAGRGGVADRGRPETQEV
jgi:hypothetical protein